MRQRLAVAAGSDHAGDAAVGDRDIANRDAFFHRGAGLDRAIDQPLIQDPARDRAAGDAAAVPAAHLHAARAGQQHAVDRIALRDQRRDVGMTAQHGERAGIQRVAAQLVPGKPRAIEDADAQARHAPG